MTFFIRCSAPSASWSPLSCHVRMSPQQRLRVFLRHRIRRACQGRRRVLESAAKEDRHSNPYEGCQQEHEHEGQNHYFYREPLDGQSHYSPPTARINLLSRGRLLSAAEIPHSVVGIAISLLVSSELSLPGIFSYLPMRTRTNLSRRKLTRSVIALPKISGGGSSAT